MSDLFSKQNIEELSKLMETAGLEELELTQDTQKIRLRKPSLNQTIVTAPTSVAAAQTVVNSAVQEAADASFKSPMVGTLYFSPSADSEPFVTVGSKVKKGQVVCIIEAMKTFNQIEADFDGVITNINHSDASPIEFNSSIFSYK